MPIMKEFNSIRTFRTAFLPNSISQSIIERVYSMGLKHKFSSFRKIIRMFISITKIIRAKKIIRIPMLMEFIPSSACPRKTIRRLLSLYSCLQNTSKAIIGIKCTISISDLLKWRGSKQSNI